MLPKVASSSSGTSTASSHSITQQMTAIPGQSKCTAAADQASAPSRSSGSNVRVFPSVTAGTSVTASQSSIWRFIADSRLGRGYRSLRGGSYGIAVFVSGLVHRALDLPIIRHCRSARASRAGNAAIYPATASTRIVNRPLAFSLDALIDASARLHSQSTLISEIGRAVDEVRAMLAVLPSSIDEARNILGEVQRPIDTGRFVDTYVRDYIQHRVAELEQRARLSPADRQLDERLAVLMNRLIDRLIDRAVEAAIFPEIFFYSKYIRAINPFKDALSPGMVKKFKSFNDDADSANEIANILALIVARYHNYVGWDAPLDVAPLPPEKRIDATVFLARHSFTPLAYLAYGKGQLDFSGDQRDALQALTHVGTLTVNSLPVRLCVEMRSAARITAEEAVLIASNDRSTVRNAVRASAWEAMNAVILGHRSLLDAAVGGLIIPPLRDLIMQYAYAPDEDLVNANADVYARDAWARRDELRRAAAASSSSTSSPAVPPASLSSTLSSSSSSSR